MKNKASKLANGLPWPTNETEFKIVIEKSKVNKKKIDVHLYLDGVIDKSFLGASHHYHIVSPFGDDAD